MDIQKVNQYYHDYKDFGKDSYIMITNWSNGEGYNVDLNGKCFSLSWEEIDQLNYGIDTLRRAPYELKKD